MSQNIVWEQLVVEFQQGQLISLDHLSPSFWGRAWAFRPIQTDSDPDVNASASQDRQSGYSLRVWQVTWPPRSFHARIAPTLGQPLLTRM